MIVTCPNCASKYRVKDEKVPEGGAQLRCPECDQLFIAKPPKKGEVDAARAAAQMREEKEKAESRISDLERIVEGLREEVERRKAETAQVEADKILLMNEVQDAEQRLSLAESGLEKSRADGRAAAEQLPSLEAQVREQRGLAERVQQDLALAQQTIQALKQQVQRLQTESQLGSVETARVEELQREIETLKARQPASSGAMSVPPDVKAMMDAVAPMLWGLEQAITYMEPYAPNQAELMNHLKQLKLLVSVLKRLKEAIG